jgi:hypothetical protein
MAEEKFKLPRSSYEEITKIIKAYGHFEEPVSLDEVSKFIGMNSTVISRNSGFLLEIEVLQPGAKKVLTSMGRQLAQALEHEMPDEIRNWWQQVVTECDFIAKLVSAVKIRKGMDDVTLQSHIAYSAGQPKKAEFMTGARTIVDILRAAELIAEKDGKFNAIELHSQTSGEPIDTAPTKEVSANLSSSSSIQATPSIVTAESNSRPHVNINIELKVDCNIDDLDGLGQKLKDLIKDIQENDNSGNTENEQDAE